jgi:hypothetical protein
MDKEELIAHKKQRKELWVSAWINTANAANCSATETATKWADKALEEFDKRFPMVKTND